MAARDYFAVRGELSAVDGVLLWGDRIVIPPSMRQEILGKIHDGHLGISKCRERARQGVWWPQISKDIQNMGAKCRYCLQKRPSQPRDPLIPTELPDRPFQHVAVDLCELRGKLFLVLVDYYSRWIDNNRLHRTLKLVSSPICLCGQEDKTAEHFFFLQRCPLHKSTREDVWPVSTPLTTKFYGCKQELEKTA